MNLDSHKQDFEKIIERLRNEFSSLRTSRATPALVENIIVEAYGARQSLKTLASLNAPDPKTLLIDPWDKSLVKEIEKAIVAAGVGLNPVNEGSHLRIVLPSLTEESRRELVKLLSAKLEESRQMVRASREKIRASIQNAERSKEVTEDEKYELLEKLDEMVGKYNDEMKKMGEMKEKEIMTV